MPHVRPAVYSSTEPWIKELAIETHKLRTKEKANIYTLAQGQANLPIFDEARQAMQDFLNKEHMPYTEVAGMDEVRDTVVSFVKKFYPLPTHGGELSREHVLLTTGVTAAAYSILTLSIHEKDDVVLSPLPVYAVYEHQTAILGGTFDGIVTKQERRWKPTIEDMEKAFQKHTKTDSHGRPFCNVRSVMLCFPNNPCGTLLTADEARSLADFLDRKLEEHPEADFSVILDEVYLGLTNSMEEHHSIISYASPRLLKNTFLVLSASKGLGAMPGERAGFLVCFDDEVNLELVKVQSALTANASITAQIGLQASLQHIIDHPDALTRAYHYYHERTSYCVQRLNQIAQKYMKVDSIAEQPQGTFYVLAFFAALPGVEDDVELHAYLRDMYKHPPHHAGLEVVPGCGFNLDPKLKMVRFSCAVEMDTLQKGMDVLEEAVKKLAEENKGNREEVKKKE